MLRDNIKALGIMGGAFNPIHFGHLLIAQSAASALSLEKVLFIPTSSPPHKDNNELIENVHRLEMTHIAVSSNPLFEVSDVELNRCGRTYTVDTLAELKNLYPSAVLYLILGSDCVCELTKWKDYKKIIQSCEFISTVRSGFSADEYNISVAMLEREHGAKIHTVEMPMYDVSSTLIRSYISRGKSVRYLVPDDIYSYILDNDLFKSG